jgi:hypothetical protein
MSSNCGGGVGPGKKGTRKQSSKIKYENKTFLFYDNAAWKKLDGDD